MFPPCRSSVSGTARLTAGDAAVAAITSGETQHYYVLVPTTQLPLLQTRFSTPYRGQFHSLHPQYSLVRRYTARYCELLISSLQ
ncbi:hypothetical protein E2C01_043504 [Portunus trituberculatus]|uniref:Uncharacterized protein n=1 Tax=Portunus trituberculatus TaxID=210409 RepID=A0A5B7FT52_PORTR|nr:hypothetical protein [Portunus trituberculatus]